MSKRVWGEGTGGFIMLEKLFKNRELDRQVIKIKLDKIKYGKFQPRFIIDDHELEELVESIREVGVLQPVVVRPG